jgi:transcriptional regulator with XRE-family HTH domain
MDVRKSVGARIKNLRKEKNFTQQMLSDFSGIERTFISHIEKGKRNVTIETIQTITSALQVSIKYFFDYDGFKDIN